MQSSAGRKSNVLCYADAVNRMVPDCTHEHTTWFPLDIIPGIYLAAELRKCTTIRRNMICACRSPPKKNNIAAGGKNMT